MPAEICVNGPCGCAVVLQAELNIAKIYYLQVEYTIILLTYFTMASCKSRNAVTYITVNSIEAVTTILTVDTGAVVCKVILSLESISNLTNIIINSPSPEIFLALTSTERGTIVHMTYSSFFNCSANF